MEKNKKISSSWIEKGHSKTSCKCRINILGRKINKSLLAITGSEIMLTNNGIKDIIKVITSLENKAISLKRTTKKILATKEDSMLTFLVH